MNYIQIYLNKQNCPFNNYVADQLQTSGYLQQRKKDGLEISQETLPFVTPP